VQWVAPLGGDLFLNHGFGDVSLGSAGQESATAVIHNLKPDAILAAI
jgi:hypothetical protein